MCIGGVFGGLDSGVTEATTDVFLESAYFHPTWIRKTARRFGLNTDASFRFERGIDPNSVIYNLKLAAMLVKELAGGEICGDIIDVKDHDFPGFPVELSYDYVKRLIGKDIPHNVIRDIVKSLEMDITAEDEQKLQLVVPPYRVDVQRPCDVVEDILRVYGYNNVEFTSEVHSSLSNKTGVDFADDMQETVSNQLTSVGYHEIMNNSLTVGAYYEGLTTYPADLCVRIMNPLSSDLNVMRQTLLYGGMESIAHNANRKNANLRFFEFGNVYYFSPEKQNDDDPMQAYKEQNHLGLWVTGRRVEGSWAHQNEDSSFFELSAYVENVFRRIGLKSGMTVRKKSANPVFSAGITIENRGGKVLCEMGVLTKKLQKKFGIDNTVYYAEMNWTQLMKVTKKNEITFTEVPKFPAVSRDLALLVDNAVEFAQIEQIARQTEKKLLKRVELFDVYEGEKLPAGKKSYAVNFILQDEEKTMGDKQIDAIMQKLIANLKKQLNAELR
jgi:phenylalanyl-tRNA synthetase beta chain